MVGLGLRELCLFVDLLSSVIAGFDVGYLMLPMGLCGSYVICRKALLRNGTLNLLLDLQLMMLEL